MGTSGQREVIGTSVQILVFFEITGAPAGEWGEYYPTQKPKVS